MKRFSRVICIMVLAFSTVIGFGSFSTASADGHHHHGRYERAYRHCAHHYRVGGYRFQRCMDYELGRRHDW